MQQSTLKKWWILGMVTVLIATPLVMAQDGEDDEVDEGNIETLDTPTTPVPAETEAPSKNPKHNEMISKAIRQLVAEAMDLDYYEPPAEDGKPGTPEKKIVQPVFKRPHPVLSNFTEDMAIPTLRRMLTPFTGNEYRDTYIRWHMMHVVKQAYPEDKRGREVADLLVKLAKQLPGPLAVKSLPEYQDVPPDVAAKWKALMNACQVVIGYPPFQKRIGPPASFKEMSGAQRAAAEAKYAEALALDPDGGGPKGAWHRITDRSAIARNRRIRDVNFAVREYRGEVIYALLETGDPPTLNLVVSEIGRQMDNKSKIGFDLLAFMYLAAFDGLLELYPTDVLNQASRNLQKIAQRNEGFVEYGRQSRNFADYAFHMVHMLKDVEGLGAPDPDSEAPREPLD